MPERGPESGQTAGDPGSDARAAAATTYVFVDTSVFMHCMRFSEIDWPALAGSSNAAVVVLADVLRELNRQKDGHRSRGLRERARDIIVELEAALAGSTAVPLRPGVSVQFERGTGVRAAAEEHGLDTEVADERILTAILAFRAAHPARRIVVVARDTAMRLTAESFGLEAIAPPPELERKEEADPLERELRELRRENAALKANRPVLEVQPVDGRSFIEIRLQQLQLPPDDALERAVAAAMERCPPYMPPLPEPTPASDASERDRGLVARLFGGRSATFPPPPVATEQYAQERELYRRNLRAYLQTMARWRQRQGLTGILRLSIHNTGATPATDISLALTLPAGVHLETDATAPRPPSRPPVPEMPRTSIFVHREAVGLRYSAELGPSRSEQERAYLGGTIDLFAPEIIGGGRDPGQVRFHLRKLQQQVRDHLEAIRLVFVSPAAQRSFTMPFELRADDMMPVTGSLHVAVRVQPAPSTQKAESREECPPGEDDASAGSAPSGAP